MVTFGDEVGKQPSKQKFGRGATDALNTYIEHDKASSRPAIIQQKWYIALVGIIVFINLQVIVAETDWACLGSTCTPEDRALWNMLDLLFAGLFVIDIVVRVFVTGPGIYFRGNPGEKPLGVDIVNCLDFAIVLLQVVDVCMLGPIGIYTELKLFSMLRVLHLTSWIKRIQLMSAFRELWLIVADIWDTIKSVVWVLLLLTLLMWVMAILITIVAGKDISWKDFDFSRSAWKKDDYWGTTAKSLYSMFQVVTRDHWSDSLAGPLVKRYPPLMIIFVVFMTISSLALLNTIVGVVVESTLSSAQLNAEKQDKEKDIIDKRVMASLQEIFEDADTDHSGDLDRKELSAAIKSKPVRHRLKMLDIPFKDLELLFTLLDDESNGLVAVDRFFRSCARLRGPAMSADLYQMSVDLGRSIEDSEQMIQNTNDSNDMISDLLDDMDVLDLDIVKGDTDDRDPVLLARRERPRKSRGDFLRSAANPNYVPSGRKTDDSEDAFEAREPSKQSRFSETFRTPSKSLVAASLRAMPDARDYQEEDPSSTPKVPAYNQNPKTMARRQKEMPSKETAIVATSSINAKERVGAPGSFQWPT